MQSPRRGRLPPQQKGVKPWFMDETEMTEIKDDRKDPLSQYDTVAIFGLGRSGLAAAHLLSQFGKRLIVSDTADASKRAELEAKLPAGATLILGHNEIGDAQVIVTSPGLEPSSAIFEEAHRRGIPVLAELELGYLASALPLVAISGTDGKTTTTTLTSHILATCGVRNLMGGNVGIPLCECLLDTSDAAKDLSCYVVETSAFQLSFCPGFRAHIFIATNIAEDHAEYFHNDWEQYVSTKRRPLSVMTAEDIAILNASDAYIRTWNKYTSSQCIWYAETRADLPKEAVDKAWLEADVIHVFYHSQAYALPMSTIHLRGKHNAMNVMCAVLASLCMGCAWSDIVSAIASYTLPPHRIQTVCEKDGVFFIDDSKATNPHAAIAGLMTVDEPLILIAGGVDKGLSLSAWIELMKKNVRALVLIGALTERLHAEAVEGGLTCPIERCQTLEDAVARGYALAKEHGAKAVLLSPACSSYDMFKSYGQRGDVFAAAARNL